MRKRKEGHVFPSLAYHHAIAVPKPTPTRLAEDSDLVSVHVRLGGGSAGLNGHDERLSWRLQHESILRRQDTVGFSPFLVVLVVLVVVCLVRLLLRSQIRINRILQIAANEGAMECFDSQPI